MSRKSSSRFANSGSLAAIGWLALWVTVPTSAIAQTSIANVASVGESSPDGKLVATMLQNEPRRLPKDNTAMFLSRSRSIGIEVEYLVASDREAEREPVRLTAIAPNGRVQKLEDRGDGRFLLRNVNEGLHSLVAVSASSVAAVPFYATRADERVGGDALPVSDRIVRLPMVPRGRDVADRLARQYASVGDVGSASIKPVRYQYTLDEPHGYQVRLTEDARLRGQIIIAGDDFRDPEKLAMNNIFLVKDGRRSRSTVTNRSGAFEFDEIKPGPYGLVAIGPAGYTAFGFEVLPGNLLAKTPANVSGERTTESMTSAGYVVAQAEPVSDVLPVVMIPPNLAEPSMQAMAEEDFDETGGEGAGEEGFPDEGISTPGFAGGVPLGPGGGFGGGGGGGGLGGLGGILGEAASAAGAAALAAFLIDELDEDDDDEVFQPVPNPVSVSRPFVIR